MIRDTDVKNETWFVKFGQAINFFTFGCIIRPAKPDMKNYSQKLPNPVNHETFLGFALTHPLQNSRALARRESIL